MHLTGLVANKFLRGGLFRSRMSRIAMTFVFTLLLCGLTLSLELCDLNVYNSYLEAYPMKCGSDCDEYKKWVVKMGG